MEKIYWSHKAKSDYWSNIDFIVEHWDVNVAHKFIEKTNQTISVIQSNPDAYPLSDYKNVRRAVIIPQIVLFYQINKDVSIDLLRFWSSFQSPDKITF
ncbi:type II toxin-antitoxin system RelE/ParE family toxin [Rhodohalobacter sp.]|uniref:type II toxin-antitoxin system RelE/ParE family toxin n=1 Tax=Rhodohalobacter sp. TaxID=1974210 RepID=UPI002ACD230F|nr:type II toxin-antitoxin system RelE/ParE family toxin [Rhodohalobacter sp.]MDZ7756700.1 type II toxin-antitoxin system RelE/ParE family toxin [Rhodohalobacter sp.]